MATTEPNATGVQAEALQQLLDGRYADLRQRIREVLAEAEFAPPLAMPTAEYRDRVCRWMRRIADEGLTAPGFPVEFGGQDDPGANIAGFETIAYGDLSLLVKFGVQFGLWGGAIQRLGTRIHHERYLKPTAALELIGCFAMTETGHGSNVQQLGTTATYDPAADEFVVNTPTEDARKDYIGNAACHAEVAAVFAQLIAGGESHGVHVLVVPIRDAKGNVHEGVRIEDCSEKMGLNGVDNGRIWFDNVRVPREALLNRYGGVNEVGAYESPIEKPNKRFFTMLGALTRWREGHVTASIAQRFKRGIDEGYDPFEVFRAVQNHAVDAARAHMERSVLEAFANAVDACELGPHQEALSRMCDLYALYAIEQDRGYLQEHGRLTGPRCKAVTREVNRLCDDVRGDAEALVDAFGIPDGVLRAPIGLRGLS